MLRVHGARGGNHVLDADICDYFGSIDHDKAAEAGGAADLGSAGAEAAAAVARGRGDGRGRSGRATVAGTPQGGVISPLLSNIYLHVLDRIWEDRCAHLGTLVRYADDFVVMCDTKAAVEEARQRVSTVLTRLGLELHPEKTRTVDLSRGREGFDFLGCHLHKRMSGRIWERTRQRVYYLHRWPSQRAMARVRARVRALTPRSRCHEDLRRVIADAESRDPRLGPVLSHGKRGGANSSRSIGTSRIGCARLLAASGRASRSALGAPARWNRPFFEALGLYRLRGTIQYPEAA